MSRFTTNIYFPTPSVKIYMEGKWEKVTSALKDLGPAIQKGYDKAVSKYSRKLLRVIKEAIQGGGPPGSIWKPQADSTMATYKAHGWVVGKPYYRTGLFYRSLGMYSYRGKVYIGLPSNTRTENGLTLVQLARILEAGTDKIPARPLFAPSLEAVGGTTTLRREILKSIRSELGHLGFKPNQIKM